MHTSLNQNVVPSILTILSHSWPGFCNTWLLWKILTRIQ